jgi:AdoMet-dependent heme synthase
LLAFVRMTKFDERPFIAIWEMTQACDLACAHCRASARPERDSGELSTEEAKQLLRRFAEEHIPLVVLTGGDPAKRPDLVELVGYGRSLGLHLGLTPSATPLVTRPLIRELAQAGLSRLAVSVDGADAPSHDAFRGVTGSFAAAERILDHARDAGLRTQINTSLHAGNVDSLSGMADFVRRSGAVLWSVFLIVPTGRATASQLPSAEVVESRLCELVAIAEHAPFAVKTTEAPHYRRLLLQHKKRTGKALAHGVHGASGLRVNDGRGFLFVSHSGQVFPSGFLPLDCGNVRGGDALAIYREHPTFRALRDETLLTGKCGACEYRLVCGGSRARAYAMTGSALGSDPLCAYVPAGYGRREPRRLPVLVS